MLIANFRNQSSLCNIPLKSEPSPLVQRMSMMVNSPLYPDDVDILAGALYAWCAERSIKLQSQEGLSAANVAIGLYDAGYQTQDQLLGALHQHEFH